MRDLIHVFKKEFQHQTFFDIQVLEFRSNHGKERGIDWNVLRDIGSATGSLEFVIPGTNTISQGSTYGLAFKGAGKWDGRLSGNRKKEKHEEKIEEWTVEEREMRQ